MRDYKIVILGVGGVGKSALTVQFVQGVYVESYDPTIEDSYRKHTEIDGRSCTLEILDTAGVEQFTAMRELYIKNGQGFILVYSVTNKSSLEELLALRDQVVRIKDNTNIPMVLVANKCDLEDDREISPDEGVQTADSWGRIPFYETSAKYRLNVDEIFVDLVRQIMRRDSAFGGSSLKTISNGGTASVASSGNLGPNYVEKRVSSTGSMAHAADLQALSSGSKIKVKERKKMRSASTMSSLRKQNKHKDCIIC